MSIVPRNPSRIHVSGDVGLIGEEVLGSMHPRIERRGLLECYALLDCRDITAFQVGEQLLLMHVGHPRTARAGRARSNEAVLLVVQSEGEGQREAFAVHGRVLETSGDVRDEAPGVESFLVGNSPECHPGQHLREYA